VRLVQVMVPAGKRDAVLDVLDSRGIDYVMSDETSGREYTAVVSFPIPTSAVETVLDQLREQAGIDRDAYTVVLDAETVISQKYEQLEKEWEEGADGERIARDELVARASDLAPDWVPFLVMTFISAVVATAGLLLDSAAVVVGSMVIAPLIGPAMATSVGSVVDDRELFVRGVKLQAVGALLAVGGAALFAAALRFSNIIPLGAVEVLAIDEVQERLSPGVPSLVVALAAGVAGALSLSSGVSAALVGVMIAAALVPPTAVVGIGIAWGEPIAVFGSAVLVAVNFLSINFAALAVFLYKGYRPEEWFKTDAARRETIKRIGTLGVVILLLSAFLGSVTYASYQRATFEDEARQSVSDLVDAEPTLSLVAFEVEHGVGFPFRSPERVIVTIGYPPGTDPPSMVDRIFGRVAAIDDGPFGLGFDDGLQVEVHYTAMESTGSEATNSRLGRPDGTARTGGIAGAV
jgi:uncharacterized hydrophobic protein (TIGR00341 family)